MKKSTFDLEKKLSSSGYEVIIGIDEAGRGPLAGPVVAAAVAVRDASLFDMADLKLLDSIRDSKTLSEKQREKIFDFIQENFWVGVGIASHETIDRINILEATFFAMKKAITNLHSQAGKEAKRTIILTDGNKKIPNLSGEQEAIVNGDGLVKSISAASIIAKVTRDRIMLEAHAKYPQYAFDKHKGYGTKVHMDSLREFGPCEIHRKSFAPVSEAALAPH
jgi:ribonuclease HII